MTVPSGAPFRILVVCTGNLCRSPQTAQLLQACLDEACAPVPGQAAGQGAAQGAAPVAIGSAGTHARPGAAMDPRAAELSRGYGAIPERHRARQLSPAMVETADLVLCMTREHRRAVVRQVPRASRCTFLLTEFAALLEDAEQTTAPEKSARPGSARPGRGADDDLASQLRRAVRAAAARRGQLPRRISAVEEIVDPYGAEASVHRESAAQIHRAVARIHSAMVSLIQQAES